MSIADLRPGLYEFLLTQSDLAVMVGGERIYPVILPQGQVNPSLVYNRVSGLGSHHMQGPSGLSRPRYQIDAYAQTPDEANALADLVKFHLDGFQGLMGSVNVQGVFFDTEREDYQADVNLFRVSRDYIIWLEER